MKSRSIVTFFFLFFLIFTFVGCVDTTTTIPTTAAPTTAAPTTAAPTTVAPTTVAPTTVTPTTVDTTPAFTVPGEVILKVGYTYQITPTAVSNVASFDYLSTDYDIVDVDDEGFVTAIAAGTVIVVVAGDNLTKNITFIVEENLLNGVSVGDLKAMASFSQDQINVENPANAVWNIGWDQATEAATALKMDFSGTAPLTQVILRGYASAGNYSVLENGHYVIVMIGGANAGMTEATTPEGVHASVYAKMTVSDRANHFRLWGWSAKDSVVSGRGSFRVVAYELNEDGLTYTAIPLTARDSGSLVQDENGWISYVDCQPNNQIVDAPADNMFIYDVANEDYDIKGKEILLFVEFRASANTLGAENANKQDRFGIKRIGFVNDPDPSFTIQNGATATLIVDDTLQLTMAEIGGVNPDNYIFESNNEAVATVSGSGLITAVAVGEATIIVQNGTIERTITITVNPVPTSSFDLDAIKELMVSEPYQIIPTNIVSIDSFTYSSNNSYVATVATDGTVTAKTPGIAVITVSGGDVQKQQTITISATTLFGKTAQDLEDMEAFTADEVDIEATGGNVLNFVAPWGATGEDADKIDLAGTAPLTSKLIRTIHALDPLKSLINLEEHWFEMINGIGMTPETVPTALPHSAAYFKTVVPNKANFRVWLYSAQLGDPISGQCMFRIVMYVPNEDYTSFTAVPLVINFQENPAVTLTSLENGYYTYENGADMFVAVTVPEHLKGQEVFVSIETIARVNLNNYQDRMAVKRMGFIN